MIRGIPFTVLILGSFALLCRCQSQEKDLESLQQVLEGALQEVPAAARTQVDKFVDILDGGTLAGSTREDERYKRALIAYRESQGPEATATAAKRNQLFDELEQSCECVRDHLREFAQLESEFKRNHRVGSDDVSTAALIKLAGNPHWAQVEKWAHVRWVCLRFLAKFASGVGHLDDLQEIRALGQFDTNQAPGSRPLSALLRRGDDWMM